MMYQEIPLHGPPPSPREDRLLDVLDRADQAARALGHCLSKYRSWAAWAEAGWPRDAAGEPIRPAEPEGLAEAYALLRRRVARAYAALDRRHARQADRRDLAASGAQTPGELCRWRMTQAAWACLLPTD